MIFAAAGEVDLPLWAGISSAIFFAILAYTAGPPLLKALRNRERSIVEVLAKADIAHRELEALRAKNAVELARVQREAKEMLAEGKRDAAALREELVEQARQEIDRIKARTSRDIGLAENAARVELYRLAADRAFEVARKVLESEIKPDDHKRLVDRSFQSLERTLVGGRA
jgi:F-type H+-transporting ATPase subunit b